MSGLLFALAFLTKQSALPLALPLAAYAVYADRRRGWLLGASLGAAALAASELFNWASRGWYGYYVFNAAAAQPLASGPGLSFGWTDWLASVGPITLAALVFLAFEWRAGRPIGFWLALGAGTLGTTFWVQLYQGAVENNRLPMLAALAVLAGLGVARAVGGKRGALDFLPLGLVGHRPWQRGGAGEGGRRDAGERPRPEGHATGAKRPLDGLVYAACLLQFGLLAYNPLHRVPTAANQSAALALEQKVAQADGNVWLPQHGGLTWLAGKPSGAHLAAIEDVLAMGGPAASQLLDEVRAALRERRFAAIIVDGPGFAQRFPELEQNYAVAGDATPGLAFYSVSGPRSLPEVWYVPRLP